MIGGGDANRPTRRRAAAARGFVISLRDNLVEVANGTINLRLCHT